ncbi:DUF6443 domain-containing protein, partial [Flagellimonas abyssi]
MGVANAQYTLYGPSSALTGESKTYGITGSDISYISWTANNGATITNTTYTTATYKFNNSGRSLVSCTVFDEFNNSYTKRMSVTVCNTLESGGISGAQTICSGQNPLIINNATLASGGDGDYSYQWHYSEDGTNWNVISGATGINYDPPSLTASRWFRRQVNSCNQFKRSNIVKITVAPSLSAGVIQHPPNSCYGGNPGVITVSTNPSGGDGNYSYSWEYSSTGTGSWSPIANANDETYDPPGNATSSIWYRRKVTSCNQVDYTEAVQVKVYLDLNPGTIMGEDTICYGQVPSVLGSISSASGGNSITTEYQWQQSSTNGETGFSNIDGAFQESFTPTDNLYADRWYRRRVISCSQTKYSNVVEITVRPELSAGSINGGGQSFCGSGNPGMLGSGTNASGGDGNYVYQWERSTTSETSGFTSISGATGISYDPPVLYATTWYRRQVVSCGQIKETNTVQVTVDPMEAWYADTDGDGFGDPNDEVNDCVQPEGYVSDNSDQCPEEYGTNNGCSYIEVELSDENYLFTVSYQKPHDSMSSILSKYDVNETVSYYDGLGRPMQEIAIKASPDLGDIVTHIGYDDFGRTDREWLPYAAGSGGPGSYRAASGTETDSYYMSRYGPELGTVPNPFSRRELEASPLNRVLRQAAPGKDWQLGEGNEIEFVYDTNVSQEVRKFRVATIHVNSTYNATLIDGSGNIFYSAGELYKTITYDENH